MIKNLLQQRFEGQQPAIMAVQETITQAIPRLCAHLIDITAETGEVIDPTVGGQIGRQIIYTGYGPDALGLKEVVRAVRSDPDFFKEEVARYAEQENIRLIMRIHERDEVVEAYVEIGVPAPDLDVASPS